jgi:plastocyanin
MFTKRTSWLIGAALALLLAWSALLFARAQTPMFPLYIPFTAKTFITSNVTAVITIDIVDYEFQPFYGGQAGGVTITWINKGSTAHTVTFDDGIADSGPIQPGQRFTFTLPDEVGLRLTYHCSIHPGMTGIIDVLPGNSGPPTPTPTQ